MLKTEFLAQLRKGLSRLTEAEIEEFIEFYNEMIDDRMEEGLDEAEAVDSIGDIDSIVTQILTDAVHIKPAKQAKSEKRKLSALEITLLVLGSPIWFSLLISIVAVVFSLYVSLWAVIVSLWSVVVALIGCAVAGLAGGTIIAIWNKPLAGLAAIGCGIICAGVSILFILVCNAVTKATIQLTGKLFRYFKHRICSKEETHE